MLTRRSILRLFAAAPALACSGDSGEPGPTPSGPDDPYAVPESMERFPRTPMAGDMTKTRAVLTFFVADDSAVTLQVWTDEGVVVDQPMAPSGDGFHKVMVDDLVPGTTYAYTVFGPDFADRGLIGQFRTPPEDDVLVPVRIALMACIGQGTVLPDYVRTPSMENPTVEPFQWEIYTHASDHDLDALVHLGDQGYMDNVWKEENGTLEAYLEGWGAYHGGGYRDLYPLAGLYVSRDDHEAVDNGQFDPWDTTPEEDQKLDQALQAWVKVMPIDATEVLPIWRSFRWGATLELVLLDCRYELTDEVLMTEAQLAFLLERIERSDARFICVATPKPFADIASSATLFTDNADRWDGFPDQRRRVLDAIDARGGGVIFVTGDIHMTYLGRATTGGDAPSDNTWEVCTTSGNINPLASSLDDEQFVFVEALPNLPVLTFDPDADSVHVAFYGKDGSLTHEQTLIDV